MKIGVTGTREGSTDFQLQSAIDYMKSIPLPAELHHGDCLGVDAEIAFAARELGWKVVCHPPTKLRLRAYHDSDEFREPAGYLQRDRAIVDECDFLMVLPLHMEWQNQGGTWYTHDYAVKINKPYKVFWPEKTK